jgi:hypothetical protein
MALNSQDLLVDSSPAHAQIVSKPPTLHMRWSGEWFALAFGDLCLRFVGDLAFAYSSRFQRIGICSGDPVVIIVHSLVGVPLSFCWRASGTLVLPAAAHALVDAYRNTVL